VRNLCVAVCAWVSIGALPRGQLTVVPWNWDIKKERYDGLFISNGPGDPAMCEETVNNLRWAIDQACAPALRFGMWNVVQKIWHTYMGCSLI
jgi:hypothetical protein